METINLTDLDKKFILGINESDCMYLCHITPVGITEKQHPGILTSLKLKGSIINTWVERDGYRIPETVVQLTELGVEIYDNLLSEKNRNN